MAFSLDVFNNTAIEVQVALGATTGITSSSPPFPQVVLNPGEWLSKYNSSNKNEPYAITVSPGANGTMTILVSVAQGNDFESGSFTFEIENLPPEYFYIAAFDDFNPVVLSGSTIFMSLMFAANTALVMLLNAEGASTEITPPYVAKPGSQAAR